MFPGDWSTALRRLLPDLPENVARVLSRFLAWADVSPLEVLSMTDDELLSIRGFGVGSLRAFRAVHPAPVVDGWREHSEMVAGLA